MSVRSNLQTDQARARWAAEYREARKVRKFEARFMPDGGLSSLHTSVDHDAYMATFKRSDFLAFKRRLGRFGTGGKLLRCIDGPMRKLPA